MQNLLIATLVFLSSNLAIAAPTKVRLGWQIPWAVQGQIVQIWKNTDILKKHDLEIVFIGKTFGPELNELALADAVDVILTADQPATVLFAKDKGWLGIGRLMYNRTATYVPNSSMITSVAALRGKTIALPMGAAAERVTLAALKKAGINPQKDTRLINLDIKEQIPLVKKYAGNEKFGDIDALSGFDPTPAILEAEGLVRVIDTGKVVSMIVAQSAFLQSNPKAAEKLLGALRDAYDYYRQNTSQADAWFIAESKLQASPKALSIAASLEPNLKAKSIRGIHFSFSKDDFIALQQSADFLSPNLKKTVEMKKFVTNEYTKRVK